MARLTDTFVRSAKPGKFEDGDGLRLVVTGAAKKWVLRYQVAGKRKEMGLGGYPAIKLADARRLAGEARAKLANGADPIAARVAARKAENPIPTFGEIAKLPDFNTMLVENPAATFAVRVSGKSMTGAGIFPGDVAVVNRARTPVNVPSLLRL